MLKKKKEEENLREEGGQRATLVTKDREDITDEMMFEQKLRGGKEHILRMSVVLAEGTVGAKVP